MMLNQQILLHLNLFMAICEFKLELVLFNLVVSLIKPYKLLTMIENSIISLRKLEREREKKIKNRHKL